jgi:uncharacterized membrane-anchored protein
MMRRRRMPTELTGPARVGRRTKDLVKRLEVGDVAIIDHRDLDRVAAEGLVAAGVAAVINAQESISGRYPNSGPRVLARAGILVVDNVGPEILDAVHDGDALRIDGGEVWRRGELVAKGNRLELTDIEAAMEQARHDIGSELRRFADNTLEYVRREADLTFLPLDLPPLRISFHNRHALVVVRGHDYQRDLKALRSYIREFRPVLIGVDGGADALLELGLKPDVIIGDFDSVSESALHCGADLVHHVHPDGRAPGRENLAAWGVPYEEFVAEGTSEDVAMLLAYEGGAELIVAVGTHATMIEFLDKGRAGMSSTFLTRLRLGPVLVDAKGVSRLYEARIRRRDIVMLVAAALVGIVTISIVSEPIHVFLDGFRVVLEDLWRSIT